MLLLQTRTFYTGINCSLDHRRLIC